MKKKAESALIAIHIITRHALAAAVLYLCQNVIPVIVKFAIFAELIIAWSAADVFLLAMNEKMESAEFVKKQNNFKKLIYIYST